MAYRANISLCILWEEELRQAAKALRTLQEAKGDKEFRAALNGAVTACQVALHGLEDDKKVAVMIGASNLQKSMAAVEAK